MKQVLPVLLLITLAGCTMSEGQNETAEQQYGEWTPLFDGSTTEGWRGYNSDTFPDRGWTVEDSMLTVLSSGGGGDIITTEKYGDFELSLEWMVEEGGNSGIFYHAIEQPTQPIYWSAPELQILDNENHPDANRGENGNRQAGSLYDLIPADPQNARPFGEWNEARIVSDGGLIQHWQNGEKVLEYERWTPEWYEMLRNSKFVDHPEFGDAHEGYIGLQDHGDTVHFRNIKIRSLE